MSNDKNGIFNSTVLITGATGFIGGLLTNELISMNTLHNAGIKLVFPVRNLQKARDKYPSREDRNKCITFIEESLEEIHPNRFDMPIDYIIHCASVTKSSIMISNPVEVLDGIVIGTKNILDLARHKRVKSMVYLSSMEVYGVIENGECLVTEDMLGDLGIFSARSCYPLGKRIAEHYCYIYHKEHELPVKIARLAQIFGYGIDPNDSRVFAQFARSVCRNEDIILHTEGLSEGNYCESQDAVNALLKILIDGQDGEAYNVVNEENTMRIRDMAKLVADKIALGKINVIYDIPKDISYGYAADTNIRLSSEKLRKLGWKPTKNLEDMYRDLIIGLGQQDAKFHIKDHNSN
ncbi:MAG: NAD(P)-dependent oxidoreductase [Anaerolineaceae bacterium]|nr:MAG: NAD(P)-dependent oxidoreductase [Anaerolineaceae bacterium]